MHALVLKSGIYTIIYIYIYVCVCVCVCVCVLANHVVIFREAEYKDEYLKG